MVVTLDQLRPYDHDPRVTRNPAYAEIKASIRERGLDAPPAITRRPGEAHYIIRNGGNTRLAILRELWSETKEERFFRIACLFRPWPARGEIVAHDVGVLKLAALKGIFSRISSEQVSYVNAPLLAEQRGVAVRLLTEASSEEYRNLLTIRGALSDGTQLSVSGTLVGAKQAQKIVEINGYDVEVPMAEHLIVMLYTDRPGIVAVYGKEFGEASINIAGMQIARREAGGEALSVLTVDSRVPDELLERVQSAIDARVMRAITIVEQ